MSKYPKTKETNYQVQIRKAHAKGQTRMHSEIPDRDRGERKWSVSRESG